MLVASLLLAAASAVVEPDLRLELVRHSLTGTHYRYRQYIDGVPVVGGEVVVTEDRTGRRSQWGAAVPAAKSRTKTAAETAAPQRAWVNVDGVARPARRAVIAIDTHRHVIRYFDAETNQLLAEETNYSDKTGRVFDPNPVTKLNDPSLQDMNDSASAVPPQAYSDVELPDVAASGPLRGPYLQIVDTRNPAVPPVDGSQTLIFDRSESGFEDVNAYFHLDRTQRHLQSLGFIGERSIAPYAIEVDTHAASGSDDSFFQSSATDIGRGALFFGEGGTDDAEDSDLLVHEYAHALHQWISPGTFFGSFNTQARAIGEAFGDYLAMSASYEAAVASGRDPFCIADWDARCWMDASSEQCAYGAGSDCLRRVDSTKTMADFSGSNTSGTEHRNAEILSSAFRSIFVALTERHGMVEGRRISDTLVVESLFGPPPNVSFAFIASRMIAIDQALYRSANTDLICAAMVARGILTTCGTMPRGELTLFQSRERGVAIPDSGTITLSTFVNDARPIERVLVAVDISHESRGDLQLTLIAPDGTEFILQNTTFDRSADIRATYGLDAIPDQSLAPLRGRSLAGEWKLRIIDFFANDVGTIHSWNLLVQFQGDEPLTARPPMSAQRRYIPVVAHAAGANGTFFQTDLRIINPGSSDEEVTLTFTPSGADGRTTFGAINVVVSAGQTVALQDLVARTFQTTGSGQLEISGDVLATSRTFSRSDEGTLGQMIPALAIADATRLIDAPLFITQLARSASFRSNIGVAEVNGFEGTVRVEIFDSAGTTISSNDYALQPFTHFQFPMAGEGSTARVSVVNGLAAAVAYGSVVDNVTGDSQFMAASAETNTPADAVAPAISAAGAGGTFWRTDLRASNLTNVPADAEVLYVDSTTGVLRLVFARRFPALSSLQVNDVLSLGESTRGVLRAGAANTTYNGVRIWTERNGGSVGQFVSFDLPSANTRELLFIENNQDFRTNVGLVSGAEANVLVTFFDAEGETIGSVGASVQPFRLVQFAVPFAVTHGRARVEVLTGRVYPYASVVDNGTGDPSFVRPD